MPPLSNKRKRQLISVQRAIEGAKKARERKKAEKARQEAEQSEGSSFESGSAGGLEDDKSKIPSRPQSHK